MTQPRSSLIVPAACALALSLCGVVMGVSGGGLAGRSGWTLAQSALIVLVAWQVLRTGSRRMRWLGIAVSIAASLRYVVWRGTHTLVFDSGAEATFSLLLWLCELWGCVMLMLGHFQMFSPTERVTPPVPDGAELPSVDVFVTTFNESLDIVRRTLVGAAALDYPRKQVWLLDDGRRPAMRALANELGVGYLTRPTNEHAKAGNLNHALGQTSGELIAQFDADHVPVRSFLRRTVPFFLHDRRLAFVQTPHHFHNPDPFQRNLFVGRHLAGEQDLFFHVVQPGNDRWNAAFFCGSNALLRRESLASIGGFATETVTEDAHTALRLHAGGWSSAYLNENLAAGLSAESFLDALTQRMRWGQGMIGILRVDPPFLIRGLTLAQRLCYTAASFFFLFGIPRLVFFLAPVMFLVFGLESVHAGVGEVLTYYVPHFLAGLFVYGAVSRNIRHTFWSEVYEASLAWPMALSTVWALLTRRKLPFRVTPKGTRNDVAQLHWKVAVPQLVLLGATLAAIAASSAELVTTPANAGVAQLNTVWCFYNVVVLAAAVLVCWDRPQKRAEPRVPCSLPVDLSWRSDGSWTRARAQAVDLSERGVRVRVMDPPPSAEPITVVLERDGERFRSEARLVFCGPREADGLFECAFQWPAPSGAPQRTLIRIMFTGPDTWAAPPPSESQWRSFARFLLTSSRWLRTRERPMLRRAPRVAGDWSAVVACDGREHLARVVDLSIAGALIQPRPERLELGEAVRLSLALAPGETVTLPGTVVRVEARRAALRFEDLPAESRANLRRLMQPTASERTATRRAG